MPLLSIGGWLLDDLIAMSSGLDRTTPEGFERGLFVTSFLGALREQAIDGIGDPTSFSDHSYEALAQWCGDGWLIEMGALIAGDDAFWARVSGVWTTGNEIPVQHADGNPATAATNPPIRGRWSSTATAAAMAAAFLAQADGQVEVALTGLVKDLSRAFEIWDALATLRRDLVDGRVTYPIAVIANAGGIPLEPSPHPLQILGAMVATDALDEILEAASGLLTESRQRATELGLRTFTSFMDDVALTDAERRVRLVAGGAHGEPESVPVVAIGLDPSTRDKAIAMAEGFLLSDVTFRESWETHREGMLGADEVSARFPAGLVLEVLCRNGHRLGEAVDDFIAHAEATAFRYYDSPASDPDADTMGAVLRLHRYAGERGSTSASMTSMIACLSRLLEERGEIPVWLGDCAEPNAARPPTTLTLGGRCGTVAAHLLLGLAEFGDEYGQLLTKGAVLLFDRIADVGLGANVNYPPRYALAIYLRLLRRTEEHLGGNSNVHRARQVLGNELERLSKPHLTSPQEAALAVLAARAAGRADPAKPELITAILKHQRFDGSWIGEPFAVAPNRGWHVSAYSSTTLTTALCYDALVGR